MQRKRNQTGHSPDKGFSLIEIIVAIAILAVIVLPLLHAFVTSSRLNAKARNKLMAIETAKNIMEQIKGYNLAEIAKGANPANPSELRFGNSGFAELEYNASESKYVVASNDSIRLNPATGKYDFYPKSENRYYYFLKDINPGGFKANALITVSKPGISADAINQIVPINVNKDIVVDATVDAANIVSKIKSDSAYPDGIRNKVTESSIYREIEITVEDNGINTVVKTEFKYFAAGVSEQFKIIRDLKTEFSDSPKEDLRSIYFFIAPWNSSGRDEKVVIHNNSNKKFNLYLVKQGSGLTPGKRISVELRDGDFDITLKSPVKIYTNIPDSQVKYTYYRNGLLLSASSMDIKKDLVESKSADEVNSLARLYDIEVKVFEANVTEDNIVSAEPLVTLTGGISN